MPFFDRGIFLRKMRIFYTLPITECLYSISMFFGTRIRFKLFLKCLDSYFGRYDHAHVAREVKITANMKISKFMKVCHDYTLNGGFWTREIDLKHPRSSNRHPSIVLGALGGFRYSRTIGHQVYRRGTISLKISL